MNAEIEDHIRKKVTWSQLPEHIKQILSNSSREYDKHIANFSIRNQLRYRGNLVRHVMSNEKRYYERIIAYSRERLMLFPYHLADMVVKGLRITPFNYYISVVEKLIQAEKSYDTLPNFTAADCLRLLGIGRNEYIDLINQSRSNRGRLFGKKNVRILLPRVPCDIHIEPWWRVEIGLVLEEDIRMVNDEELAVIDRLIDSGSQSAGELNHHIVMNLYNINQWCSENQLVLNIEKTVCTVFHTDRSKDVFPQSIKIHVKDIIVEDSTKFLGIYMDTNMNWATHLDYLHKRLNSVLYTLNMLKHHVDSSISKIMYYANFQSILTYGIIFWGGSTHSECLFVSQKLAVRTMFDMKYRDSCWGVFKRNNILTLIGLYVFRSLMFVQRHKELFEKFENLNNTRRKGLIYLDVPITAVDSVQVPPLQGFVMNRVIGDYFETLLYKIFVSIDEHISVGELANTVLEVDTELVKQAVSLYCRLQFARKLNPETEQEKTRRHSSWREIPLDSNKHTVAITPLTLNFETQSTKFSVSEDLISPDRELPGSPAVGTLGRKGQRIAFLFDSALTAFLMMGNLTQGLKKHAVTMFEVGKLCDESLDSFLSELEKVSALDADGEGEARRFFDHAVILRSTVLSLRKLPSCGLDLVRLESLQALDEATCSRLLQKKYRLLVSMAPLSREVRPVFSLSPPHLGPAVPEVNSLWFKLFIYHMTGYGPPSLLLTKGMTIKQLPRMFLGYSKLLVSTWLHEPAIIPISNVIHVNAALQYAPVLIQAYGVRQAATTRIVPFPFRPDTPVKGSCEINTDYQFRNHPASRILNDVIDIEGNCGFLTFVNIGVLDFGCENREPTVRLVQNLRKSSSGHSRLQRVRTEPSTKSTEPTSIMNENFCFSNEKDSNKDETDSPIARSEDETRDLKLQSPDERHFANTPTEDGKSSSPANGFTSDECSKLLQEELDELEKKDDKLNKILELRLSTTFSMEGLVTPSEEHVNKFSRDVSPKEEALENGEAFKPKGEMWTLLDCHFGVPLFDANANTKICDTIVSGGLAESTSLDELVEASRRLGSMLLEFISQCQYYPGENMEIMKRGKLVPQPRYNLVFDNGRVSEWPGK